MIELKNFPTLSTKLEKHDKKTIACKIEWKTLPVYFVWMTEFLSFTLLWDCVKLESVEVNLFTKYTLYFHRIKI